MLPASCIPFKANNHFLFIACDGFAITSPIIDQEIILSVDKTTMSATIFMRELVSETWAEAVSSE